MANTYTLISSVTVGAGGASSIDFTSIPATYTDLKLVQSCRISPATSYDYIVLEFNGDTTAANYNFIYLYGNGATGSGSGNIKFGGYADAASATASTFSNGEIYMPNYAGSNNKSVSADSVTENNATAAFARFGAGLWSDSSAITWQDTCPDPASWSKRIYNRRRISMGEFYEPVLWNH